MWLYVIFTVVFVFSVEMQLFEKDDKGEELWHPIFPFTTLLHLFFNLFLSTLQVSQPVLVGKYFGYILGDVLFC